MSSMRHARKNGLETAGPVGKARVIRGVVEAGMRHHIPDHVGVRTTPTMIKIPGKGKTMTLQEIIGKILHSERVVRLSKKLPLKTNGKDLQNLMRTLMERVMNVSHTIPITHVKRETNA